MFMHFDITTISDTYSDLLAKLFDVGTVQIHSCTYFLITFVIRQRCLTWIVIGLAYILALLVLHALLKRRV